MDSALRSIESRLVALGGLDPVLHSPEATTETLDALLLVRRLLAQKVPETAAVAILDELAAVCEDIQAHQGQADIDMARTRLHSVGVFHWGRALAYQSSLHRIEAAYDTITRILNV